jgi:hypothetical protein
MSSPTEQTTGEPPAKGGFKYLVKNPYLFGVALVCRLFLFHQTLIKSYLYMAQFSTLGGLLFGYDQGVVSGILTMQAFGARFPRIYTDSNFEGWFVSTLLLGTSLQPLSLAQATN